MKEQHAPALLAILKDMMVRRYDAERITHYGRSRATLDATERCDQASIHPRIIDFGVKIELWCCEFAF
jgi:hypothetical protein